MNEYFTQEYKKLNPAQKEAVDTTEGPVMVIAGPGTGKTQVLALRICNILVKTDTKADGILCLTFTNSGVRAMRERLFNYIGGDATKVKISTFHSFAGSIVEEFFGSLDFEKAPSMLDDTEAVSLVDEILENGEWEHLRPRGDAGRYFSDIKSLISLLKRESITPKDFLFLIQSEIKDLENDEESISSRGPSKGKLKKEVENKIKGLERTKEIVEFYGEYEKLKKERLLADYDDVLHYALEIINSSEDAKAEMRERYHYVLVDEHQDSSGIQNEILKAIWSDVELPNIFVVGDDRQLIYGFGGASIEYFENFKNLFGKAKLITLVENYRSTQAILDSADSLLKSTLTLDKLKSNHKEMHKLSLVECMYPRDEIIMCANTIREKIDQGANPDECAILVPKNYQVKNAIQILRDQDIQVAPYNSLTLFDSSYTDSFLRALKIVDNPYDNVALGEILFDGVFDISPLVAHKFLQSINTYKLSLDDFLGNSKGTLLDDIDPIVSVGKKIEVFINKNKECSVYELIQYVGEHLLLEDVDNHDSLIQRVEVVRTMLHLALLAQEKSQREKKNFTLKTFLAFIERLKNYGQDIPLAVFFKDKGVKVLTLHSSKGLEFDFVWVAHMNEKNLMRGRVQAFTLPKKVLEQIEEKDDLVVKRQIYVALTRAKRFCTFSYSNMNLNGTSDELAHIIKELPQDIFDIKSYTDTEKEIVDKDIKSYVVSKRKEAHIFDMSDLVDLVKEEYLKTKVSVTMLNNFFECPWKWYFRNLLRLPDSLSENLVFGNIVHGSLEQILKNRKMNLDDLIQDQIHKQNIYDEGTVKRFTKDAKSILENWIKIRLPEIEKSYETERPVSYRDPNFPHLNFYGKIDLTEKLSDNSVRVTDFKTGKIRTKSEIEKESDDGRMSDYRRQLVMYSYLIQGSNPSIHKDSIGTSKNLSVSESQLEFVEGNKEDKNSVYKTHITQEEIDLLVRDIKDYDSALKEGTWTKNNCNFKAYGSGPNQCPYCKKAEIYS